MLFNLLYSNPLIIDIYPAASAWRYVLMSPSYKIISIWVRSRNCGCLVTWFCYQLIGKPGNKTAAVSWPDPYAGTSCEWLWGENSCSNHLKIVDSVIPFGWCQSVFDGWVVVEWLACWPPLWVGQGCLWDLDFIVLKPHSILLSSWLLISLGFHVYSMLNNIPCPKIS